MNWYIATLEVKGVLKTPLVSDTLWGHIAWSIALNRGEEALRDFIAQYDATPPLLCSHAFPEGFLPMPKLRGEIPAVDPSKFKKLLKLSFIPAEMLAKPCGWQQIIDAFQAQQFPEISMQSVNRIRNSINRETSTVQEGLLWAERGYVWEKRNPDDETETMRITRFNIYCQSVWSLAEVQAMLNSALAFGYGGKAGVGYGNIKVISVMPYNAPETGNRMMLLGAVAEKPSKLPGLRSNVTVRRGKLGPQMALELQNPFKKPIALFDAGSTCDMLANAFAGTVIRNVHTDQRIVSMGMAPLMAFTEI